MSEESTGLKEVHSKFEKRISRRDFLKKAVVGLAGLAGLASQTNKPDSLFRLNPPTDSNPLSTKESEDETYRESIERKFGIQIIDTAYPSGETAHWDRQKIELLEKSFLFLPPHFSNISHLSERRPKLAVRIVPGKGGRNGPDSATPKETVFEIWLGQDEIDPSREKAFFVLIAHEIGHKFDYRTPSLRSKIEDIFGKGLFEVLEEREMHAYQKYALATKFLINPIDGHADFIDKALKDYPYYYLTYVLKRPEVVATMIGEYTGGRKHFFELFKVIFEESHVEELYNLIKYDVYKGKEYE